MLLLGSDFSAQVTALDTSDGLFTATELFLSYLISRFEAVTQLHVAVLVVTVVAVAWQMIGLFRPYIRKLHADSKAIAGLLSLLPPEVDVESIVKIQILGMRKDGGGGSMRMGMQSMADSASGGALMPYKNAAGPAQGGLPWRGSGSGAVPLLPLAGPPGSGAINGGKGFNQGAGMMSGRAENVRHWQEAAGCDAPMDGPDDEEED